MNERSLTLPASRPSRIGGWMWFALMVGGWALLFGLLLFAGPAFDDVRDTARDLPLDIELLLWLALFPFLLAVTVWESGWETWLRLLLVAVFALGWSIAFYPRQAR